MNRHTNADLMKMLKLEDFPEPPIDLNKILQLCLVRMQQTNVGTNPSIVFPVHEFNTTAKNKTRFRKLDKTSPTGLVLKHDEMANAKYFPYASAKFDVIELAQWCSTKIAEQEIEDEKASNEKD